jgi:hypothetical protein
VGDGRATATYAAPRGMRTPTRSRRRARGSSRPTVRSGAGRRHCSAPATALQIGWVAWAQRSATRRRVGAGSRPSRAEGRRVTPRWTPRPARPPPPPPPAPPPPPPPRRLGASSARALTTCRPPCARPRQAWDARRPSPKWASALATLPCVLPRVLRCTSQCRCRHPWGCCCARPACPTRPGQSPRRLRLFCRAHPARPQRGSPPLRRPRMRRRRTRRRRRRRMRRMRRCRRRVRSAAAHLRAIASRHSRSTPAARRGSAAHEAPRAPRAQEALASAAQAQARSPSPESPSFRLSLSASANGLVRLRAEGRCARAAAVA